MVTKAENLYYTFCRSFGHDDKKCGAYDFLSLARDSDSLVKLETLLHLPDKTVKDSAVNSLQKRKTDKEMRMNVYIGDYLRLTQSFWTLDHM